MEILAISGSLRRGSYNTALLRELQSCLPASVNFTLASIADIPLYNFDDEQEKGLPEAVVALKLQIKNCDGLIISTPEYNHGIPGVLKNAIDWCTRPNGDGPKLFGGRKVGIIGASGGRLGSAFAQTAWLPVLRYLNTHNYFGKQLFVGSAYQSFDSEGTVTDDDLRQHIKSYAEGFCAFLKS